MHKKKKIAYSRKWINIINKGRVVFLLVENAQS